MNNKKLLLYTFVMDYCGGTYVSQVEANDLKSACRNWAKNLPVKEIGKLGWKGKENLIEQIAECEPTALSNNVNVWFESFSIYGKTAHFNIICTMK